MHSRLSVARASALFYAALVPVAAYSAPQSDSPEALQFFEKKVRPILVEHCYSCHSADTKAAGGLRVDDRNGLLLGGDAGPAVVPGDPDQSLILQRIRHENPKRKMPKEGELLTEEQVADLVTWIQNGAAWPRERIPASLASVPSSYQELKTKHWAWQPLAHPEPPQVSDPAWPRSPIDQFILAKLESEKLAPVADADRATLLRRITYDLTGLPPTAEEIDAFVNDSAPDAFAQNVDRLLASPRFGERWGRHWLDVARYGESTGPSRNVPYPHAWKYRDYVIDAINRDLPYNQFIQEQIAGDLLPAQSTAERDRLLTATGFLAIGVKDVNQRFKIRFQMDNVDEKIDTVTRSILGLTVSCARCHDHKFDPIPTADYYALAGIFTSTEDCAGLRNKMGGGGLDYYDPKHLVTLASYIPDAPAEQVTELEAKVKEARQAWDDIRGTPEGLAKDERGRPKQRQFKLRYDKLQGDLLALTDPATRGHAVHGVREAATAADTEIRIRGEAERLGPTVPRGFLSVVEVPEAPTVNPAQSGRLELAGWLTSPKNPLASRVMANRVWHQLFGRGIVSTVDNFGVKGDAPSHPELLDYLANQFTSNGWSVKKLIRTIVLSRAYQLSSLAPAGHQKLDPANRLIWHHAPRRLDAEEMRDSMLAVAGKLELTAPTDSPVKTLRMVEIRDNGPQARSVHQETDRASYRSIYLPSLRGVIPKSLEAFDPVQQTLVTGQRDATTVPSQALYLLNSTFVRQQALAFAERIAGDTERFDTDWIQQLYRTAFSRPPTELEVARALRFLGDYSTSYRQVQPAMLAANESASANAVPSEEPKAEADAANPDDIDRSDLVSKEAPIEPKTAKAAAWMNFVQALFASGEFRFVR